MTKAAQEKLIDETTFKIVDSLIKNHLLKHWRYISSAARAATSEPRYFKYYIVLKNGKGNKLTRMSKIDQIVFDIDRLNLPLEVVFQFTNDEIFLKRKVSEQII